MPGKSVLPGLSNFQLAPREDALLQQQFKCILRDANLVSGSKNALTHALPSSPGVYFWLMQDAFSRYKIYVGKATSLRRRVSDYMREFQPHSPNDYKIRIFQEFVLSHICSAGFILYFAPAPKESLSQLEADMRRQFDPLLNKQAPLCPERRKAFQSAFELYYRQGFEAVLTGKG